MFARTRMFVKTSVVVVVLSATGCSGMRLGSQGASPLTRTEPKVATPDTGTEAPEPIRTAPPSTATVAAIEEFLERTRDYARPAVRRDDPPHQTFARAAAEHSTPAAGAAPPVVAMQSPSVDVTSVTPAPSAAMTRSGYDWGTRHVGNTEPLVNPAPLPPAQARTTTPGAVRYDGRRQPTPVLVSDRIPAQAVAATETRPRTVALPVLQSVSISAATGPHAAIAHDSGMSNVSVEVVAQPARPTWHTLIEELSKQAETRGDVLAFWRLGLARLASDQLAAPTLNMRGLSAEAKSLLESLFLTVASVREQLVDPVSSGVRTLEHVESLRREVAGASDPVVSAVALCRRVTTFGVYEEMGPTDLVAGRAAQTIVYCELDNLRAKELDDGRFETHLATRVEVLTSHGRSVWTHEEPEIIDQCRRRRRDFFLAQRVTLPATLPAGEYVLKVMVEDLLTGRTNEAIEPFVISSALSLAGQR